MSNELARRLYLFRVQAAEALRDGPARLDRLLRGEFHLNEAAAASLARFFTRQESISEIPDCDTLLVERIGNQACVEYYFHTPLPAPANEALVRVVADRLARAGRGVAVPMAADLGFVLVQEGASEWTPELWRCLLAADGFAEEFARSLEGSPRLRERFAQVAQTGLMVLRHPQGRKLRVGGARWSREQLFDLIRAAAPDFVLMRQALDEAAATACDLPTALAFVAQLPHLHLRQRWLTEPSPFADSLLALHDGPLDVTPAASFDDALDRLHTELCNLPR